MLAEKHIRYSKANPNGVGERHYLEQLQKRVKETRHLSSLKNFFTFCDSLFQQAGWAEFREILFNFYLLD